MSKSEKSKILDFLTNCHTYMGNRLLHKKFHETKNAGRRKFCSSAERCARQGKKLSKIKALSLTVKKLWLKNLKNEYPQF